VRKETSASLPSLFPGEHLLRKRGFDGEMWEVFEEKMGTRDNGSGVTERLEAGGRREGIRAKKIMEF